MKRIILLLFFCLYSFHSSSQIPVRWEGDWGNYNLAVLNKMFIDLYGEQQVELWLKNRMVLRFVWDVDTLGRIQGFKLKNNKHTSGIGFTQEKKRMLRKYIETHPVNFCFWYGDPCLSADSFLITQLQEEIREKARRRKKLQIAVPFNGELLFDIHWKGEKNAIGVSLIDSLKYQIEKYIKITNIHD